MAELRESHELFNRIADIIDFEPQKYNQGVWGESATKFDDGDGLIAWDNFNIDGEYINRDLSDLKEANRKDDACGTAACVAGWACLLSGYHPTLIKGNVEEQDTYGETNLVQKYGARFMNLFRNKTYFQYNVMCDKKDVMTPINPNTGRLLTMEDMNYEEGVTIDGNHFVRPDHIGQKLLKLEDYDARVLFDGDMDWNGDDLRRIGKGVAPDEICMERNGMDEYCDDCGYDECEC